MRHEKGQKVGNYKKKSLKPKKKKKSFVGPLKFIGDPEKTRGTKTII